ncbi:MAG: hypothetical protein AAFY82_07960 [Pseudomonadota bacterium]
MAAMVAASTMSVVVANQAVDDEPVLRLRFQDSTPIRPAGVTLRPRFPAEFAEADEPVPMPRVTFSDVGRIGKFANISTPHPNVVVAVGASADGAELGRQIDRSIMDMSQRDVMFSRQSDSKPFLGIGVRSGSARRGWSAEANMGMGTVNTPESSRLSTAYSNAALTEFEADARAHFRLRYKF